MISALLARTQAANRQVESSPTLIRPKDLSDYTDLATETANQSWVSSEVRWSDVSPSNHDNYSGKAATGVRSIKVCKGEFDMEDRSG